MTASNRLMRIPNHPVIQIAGVGIVAGIVSAVTILWVRQAADPGDVLGFLGGVVGAVVGTALAILGALWVEDRKRSQAEADGIALQTGTIDYFVASTDMTGFVERFEVAGRLHSIRQNFTMMMDVLVASPPVAPEIRALVATIRYWQAGQERRLGDLSDRIEAGTVDPDEAKREVERIISGPRRVARAIRDGLLGKDMGTYFDGTVELP